MTSQDQKLEPQHAALLGNGCERVFERKSIREKMVAGRELARICGRHGGRPRALDGDRARRFEGEGEHSVRKISFMLRVGCAILYRCMGENNEGGAEERGDGLPQTSS